MSSRLKSAWFNTKRNGSPAVLRIDGRKVTKVSEVEVGGLPEGAVFSQKHAGRFSSPCLRKQCDAHHDQNGAQHALAAVRLV